MKSRVSRFFVMFGLIVSVAFSQVPEQYEYLFPIPDAIYVAEESPILLRFDELDPASIQNPDEFLILKGSAGDTIPGSYKIASDDKTIIYRPDYNLPTGDTISVILTPIFSDAEVDSFYYTFATSGEKQLLSVQHDLVEKPQNASVFEKGYETVGSARVQSNGVSIPADMPRVAVTVNNNPGDGYIFINNWQGSPYNIIFDNDGLPVWYKRAGGEQRDFKVQKNNTISMLHRRPNRFVGYDMNFNEIKEYRAVNGYDTDEHELQVFEDGSYFLIGVRYYSADLSQFVEGGRSRATVIESCIQGFTPEGDNIFIWRPWDVFDIASCDVPGEANPASSNVRFPHMNAIDMDLDGNILLSSRHMSEVTKINRKTGEVIWRLGGDANQFEFINDDLNGPENQHDIRVVGENRYTVFDNGNEHEPRLSRAAEWELDTEAMTATLVWEYRDLRDGEYSYAHFMGNTQRLPNGNTLINWAEGYLPKVTEVTPTGEIAFEMWWQHYSETYRVFRFPWEGVVEQPYLVVEPHHHEITLLMNKFGDENVDYYKIYAGTAPNPTTLIDTSKTTMKGLTELESGEQYFFRVKAVYLDGTESDYSNEEMAIANFAEPGSNMVLNGDFDRNKSYWYFQAFNPASAKWEINDGVSHFEISNGGNDDFQVQFVQPQMELINGKEYLFEFDGWAAEKRNILAFVVKAEPLIVYSKTSTIQLTTRNQRFSFPFTMTDPTDYYAYLAFLMGRDDADVYLDNITLKEVIETKVDDQPANQPYHYEIVGAYPNPFNAQTTVKFSVAEKSLVTVELFNVLGQKEAHVIEQEFDKGFHNLKINMHDKGTGLYFVRMRAETDTKVWRGTQKIMLVK